MTEAEREGQEEESYQEETLPPVSHPGPEEKAVFPIPPPKIEGYKIISELGEAGQGQVWRALQLSTRREVALKVPRAGFAGSRKAMARFEREVELAARLKHPNIARIHDSGIHEERYYYAMDLIEGLPLNEYVEEHQLSQRQILELMRTVCQAVQHAHQKGVIHRDLKPSNIIVSEDGQPHIVDFGLAKSLGADEQFEMISIDGETVGTPAYMSPEQAAGDMDHIDTRTDVYSLGVMLFVLLTGENPHELSGSRTSVLQRITEEEIKRPRKINPEIDKELEAVLLKALARNPDERYGSAGELAHDVNNYLAGAPLNAKGPTTMYFLRNRIAKHRRPILVVSLMAVTCIISLVAPHLYRYVSDRILEHQIAGKPSLKLTFGVYTSDEHSKMFRRFSPVIHSIEYRLKRLRKQPVLLDMRIYATYDEARSALVKGHIDLGRVGPASYILAKQEDPDIQLVAMELMGGRKSFEGVFVVRKDSDINDLRDLKGRSVAFGDPNSTIGRHLSQAELADAGIHADDLSRFEYLGSHDAVAKAVIAGEFDACAIKDNTYEEYKDKLRVIARFRNVTKPWIARGDLDPNVISDLRKVLLEIKKAKGLDEIWVTGFAEACDSDYDFVRKRMKDAERFWQKKREEE